MEELSGILSLAERFGIYNVVALLAVSATLVHGRDDIREGFVWTGGLVQNCLVWSGRVVVKPLIRQWLRHREERHRLELHMRAERHELQRQIREQRLRESIDRGASERALRELAERSLPGAAPIDPAGRAPAGRPGLGSTGGEAASPAAPLEPDGDGCDVDLPDGDARPSMASGRT